MPALPKIVFFGSGPVASATLEGILPFFDIEAIITKPRAEGHRGSVPVLAFAEAKQIPVFTPRNKAELTDLFRKSTLLATTGLVVDYGIIISQSVIDSFEHGIVNSHFSLLPDWRGADPITFSILEGRPETAGVSLMVINQKLDEGDLIAQQPHHITANVTTPDLTNELIALSNSMIIHFLPKYIKGEVKTYSQPDRPATYSRKLSKEDSILDINKPADRLEREVRAFAGWPKSKINLFGHTIIVKKARIAHNLSDGALVVATGNGTFLEIQELTTPSGKTTSGAAFLRGYKK